MAVQATTAFAAAYVTTTTTPYTADAKVSGITDMSVEDSRTVLSVQEVGSAFVFNLLSARTITIAISGNASPGNPSGNDNALDAFLSGMPVYLWVVRTNIPVDSGTRYFGYVSKVSYGLPLDGLVTFDAEFVMDSTAPVAF